MLLGILSLLVLGTAWLVQRSGREQVATAEAWRGSRRRYEITFGLLVVLLANAPLFILAPWARGSDGFFPADAASHAKVAHEMARGGLPQGWLTSYLGGFPFGHHYPPLGWLLLALEMRLGVTAALAVNGLGFVVVLAASLSLYVALVRAGARPAHAACGGCFLALVSPYTPFVGGFEVYTRGPLRPLPCEARKERPYFHQREAQQVEPGP